MKLLSNFRRRRAEELHDEAKRLGLGSRGTGATPPRRPSGNCDADFARCRPVLQKPRSCPGASPDAPPFAWRDCRPSSTLFDSTGAAGVRDLNGLEVLRFPKRTVPRSMAENLLPTIVQGCRASLLLRAEPSVVDARRALLMPPSRSSCFLNRLGTSSGRLRTEHPDPFDLADSHMTRARLTFLGLESSQAGLTHDSSRLTSCRSPPSRPGHCSALRRRQPPTTRRCSGLFGIEKFTGGTSMSFRRGDTTFEAHGIAGPRLPLFRGSPSSAARIGTVRHLDVFATKQHQDHSDLHLSRQLAADRIKLPRAPLLLPNE